MSTLNTTNIKHPSSGSNNVVLNADGSIGGTCLTQTCRAWVNFDGTTASPSTIRASYNVSSVTKNATGDYTVNFTTAMVDANYSLTGSAGQGGGSQNSALAPHTFSTASIRVQTTNQASVGVMGNAAADRALTSVAIFR